MRGASANARPSAPQSSSKQAPVVVVGARGKVGSTVAGLLKANDRLVVAINRGDDDDDTRAALAVLPPSTPIWVCTTTDALGAALLETMPPDRLADCIVLQNGVVGDELRRAAAVATAAAASSPEQRNPTRVMLYLRAADPSDHPWEDGGGRTIVRPGGKHSEHAADVLPGGARVASSRAEYLRAARDKLAWCCAAWLVSQGSGGGLSLGEVAAGARGEELRALARELAPFAMAAAASEEGEGDGEGVGFGAAEEDEEVEEQQRERDACADAVAAYCASIPGAVPSRALALREWRWRNGAVLRAAARLGCELPLHAAWCERAGVGVGGVDGSPQGRDGPFCDT